MIPAHEEIYPGRGALQGNISGRDGRSYKGYVLPYPLHVVVNSYPETTFLFRKNLAITIYAAPAWAVQHFFGTTGLVTEKTAGIQGAVTTHGAAVEWTLGNIFQQPQKGIPEFTAAAEMTETANHFEEWALGNINQPVHKVTQGVSWGRKMFQGNRGLFIAVKIAFRIFEKVVEFGFRSG